jgi:molybdopterin molybdotransferase
VPVPAPVPSPLHRPPLARTAGPTPAEDLRTVQPLPAFDTAAKAGNAVAGPGPWRLSAGAVRAPTPSRHPGDWPQGRR